MGTDAAGAPNVATTATTAITAASAAAVPPPGKRIALFLDGTWNTVDNNTNVWRAKSLCVTNADQISYYSAGVGTTRGERLAGGMFGWGLDDEVLRAYEWLIENYELGDQVFLFGFSRGAYTARSLSGFISKCGVLMPGSPLSLDQLYARYRQGAIPRTLRGLKNAPPASLSLEEKWLLQYSMPVPVWFQGVWDTVGALGVPFGKIPVVSRSNYQFLDTDLMINDTHAYHAMAIDEHREAFAPTLWTRTVRQGVDAYPDRDLAHVEQRWFLGAHCDVGGGYADGLLSQIPLNWLLGKARLHGLQFKGSVTLAGNEAQGAVHDSFATMALGAYRACKLWRPFYRTLGAPPVVSGPQTTSIINETIDGSVFARWRADGTYRPKNLTAWASAQGVDINALPTSVLSHDPKNGGLAPP